MTAEYRVGWKREGRRRKWVSFVTLAAAERRVARIAGETDADLHWMCDERHGYTAGGPDGPFYSCMPPVIEGPTVEVRSVGPWEKVPPR
jgi:hypothetical protein